MGEFSKFEIVIFLVLGLVASTHASLKMGYYTDSCPKAEMIVFEYVTNHVKNVRPAIAANLLRLVFHDCFVQGCDGSILLDQTTASGNNTEKTSIINLTLKGFDFIDSVKTELEKSCPGVVSCADTLALASRDAVHVTGGPFWDVLTGRKDGYVSNANQPLIDLPFTTDNISTLESKFKLKGFTWKDLVFLSGSHTIGTSHCTSFSNRLYNFTGVGDQDPALNSTYATKLKSKCPTLTSTGSVAMDDDGSKMSTTFDQSYYTNLLENKGLLGSDAALLTQAKTSSAANELANGPLEDFFQEFADAMVKMISIDVKTGTQGNVRTNCAFVN